MEARDERLLTLFIHSSVKVGLPVIIPLPALRKCHLISAHSGITFLQTDTATLHQDCTQLG